MRKYEFTGETKNYLGHTLHRIRAVRDFGNVKAGALGGWIEKEDNLSHEGLCWVYEGAIVCDSAIVFGNAKVFDNAKVYDDAKVYGYARVDGNAQVGGWACVDEFACVGGNARIFGNAQVNGMADIKGDADIVSTRDYIVFKNWWSSGRHFTWTRRNDKWMDFSFECKVDEWHYSYFYGSGGELVKRAYQESELSGREYERIVKYVESIKKEAL